MADFGEFEYTVRRLFTSQKIATKLISFRGQAKAPRRLGVCLGVGGLVAKLGLS